MSSEPDPPRPPSTPPSTPPSFTPPPMAKPPRSALTVRDMLVALAVLVPVILVLGGITRSCSFSPGGPSVDTSRLPVVDAPAELGRLAPLVPFPVRVPAVPADWKSNSTDQDLVEGNRVVRTGYITPQGRYLRLLQSDAQEAALLAVETGGVPLAGTGTIDVGGQRWVVYGSGRDEAIWVAEVTSPIGAPVRLLITGSGSEQDFQVLAGAAVAGELLR